MTQMLTVPTGRTERGAGTRTFVFADDTECNELRAELQQIAEEARDRAMVRAVDGRPDLACVYLSVSAFLSSMADPGGAS